MWSAINSIKDRWFGEQPPILPENITGQPLLVFGEQKVQKVTPWLFFKMVGVSAGTVVMMLFFKQTFQGSSSVDYVEAKNPNNRDLFEFDHQHKNSTPGSIGETSSANLYPETDYIPVMPNIPYSDSVSSIPVAIFQDESDSDALMFVGENWNSDTGSRNYFQPYGFNKTAERFDNYTAGPIKLSDKYYSYPWTIPLPQAKRFMLGYSVFVRQVNSDGTYYLDPYEYDDMVEAEAAFGFKCVSYEDNGKLPVTCVWTERDYSKINIMTLNGYDNTVINPKKTIVSKGTTESIALFDGHVKGVAFGDKSGTCGVASVVQAVQFFDEDNNPLGDKTCLGNPNVTAISLSPTIMRVNGPTEEVAIITFSSSAPIPYSGEGQTMVQAVDPSTRQPLGHAVPAFPSEYNSQDSIGYRPYYAAAVLSDGETVVIANSYQAGDKKAGVYAVTGAWNGTNMLFSDPLRIYGEAITGQVNSAPFSSDKRIVFTFPKDGAPAAIVYSSDQSALTPQLTKTGIPVERGQNTTVTPEYLQATVGGVPKSGIVFYPNCTHGVFLKNGLPVDNFTQADITNGLIIFSHDGGWDPSFGDISCAYNNRTSTVELDLPFDSRAYPPEWAIPSGQVIYRGQENTLNGTKWIILGDFSPEVVSLEASPREGGELQDWFKINFNSSSGRTWVLKVTPPLGLKGTFCSWDLNTCNKLGLCKTGTLAADLANLPSEPSQLQAYLLDVVKIGGSVVGLVMTGGTITVGVVRFGYTQQKSSRRLHRWRKQRSEFGDRLRKELNLWGYKDTDDFEGFAAFSENLLKAKEITWSNLSEEHKGLLVKRVASAIDECYQLPTARMRGVKFWQFSIFGKKIFKLPSVESDAMGLMVSTIVSKVDITDLRPSSVRIRVETGEMGEEMEALMEGRRSSKEEMGRTDSPEDTSFGSDGSFGSDSSLFGSSGSRDSQDSVESTGSLDEGLLTGEPVGRRKNRK